MTDLESTIANARREALEEAAKLIEDGYPRPGISSKTDKCPHDKFKWEECDECSAWAIRQLSARGAPSESAVEKLHRILQNPGHGAFDIRGVGLNGAQRTIVEKLQRVLQTMTNDDTSEPQSPNHERFAERSRLLLDCIDELGAPPPQSHVLATDRLREAAEGVISSASDTYKKRNGHIGSFEDDSGEKCWIVPFDAFEGLRSALSSQPAPVDQMTGWIYDPDHPMSDGGDTRMTAAEEVLAYLLIEVNGSPDDVSYSPNDAQHILEDRLKEGRRLEAYYADFLAKRRAALATANQSAGAGSTNEHVATDLDDGITIGIAMSIAFLLRDRDDPVPALEWWHAAGLTIEQCERVGLDEYDLAPIRAEPSFAESAEG